MKLQTIHSDRVGHFVLEYDEENALSILFSVGSHTENHMPSVEDLMTMEDYTSLLSRPVSSTTVEMMARGEKIKNILKQYTEYWDEPLLNYFPVELLPELINKIGELENE